MTDLAAHRQVFGHDVTFDKDGNPLEKGVGSIRQPKPNLFVESDKSEHAKPEPEKVSEPEHVRSGTLEVVDDPGQVDHLLDSKPELVHEPVRDDLDLDEYEEGDFE